MLNCLSKCYSNLYKQCVRESINLLISDIFKFVFILTLHFLFILLSLRFFTFSFYWIDQEFFVLFSSLTNLEVVSSISFLLVITIFSLYTIQPP